MSATGERVDGAAEGSALQTILERQRRAFRDEGPPGAAVRRNRIDRLELVDRVESQFRGGLARFAPG